MPNWAAIVDERLRELGGETPDPEVVDELAIHLAQLYDAARTSGMSEDEALQHTRRLLDAREAFAETMRAKRPRPAERLRAWSSQEIVDRREGSSVMRRMDFSRDVRYALRMLLRTPGFSIIAVLTFAVGIGVNASVFSVVNAVLLRALPYPDADRITMVWLDNRRQGIREDITSYPNYVDWRDQNTTYQHLAAFATSAFNLTGAGEPERLSGLMVTANFFDVMGVKPALGGTFTAANEAEGQDLVVVISYGLWQRRFGGGHDVIGRTLSLSGRPHEVIGVMRPELTWPEKVDVWTPLAPSQQAREARGGFWLPVIGRLKPGVTLEQAQVEMGGISARLEQTYPNMRGFGANVVAMKHQLVGGIERALLVLMAAVGCVLVIVCVNLANLMLGRTAARRKELAIRTALGAGRRRIVRQIVTETMVLAAIGGTLGIVIAYWTTGFFVNLGGDSIPRADAIGVDARVLAFACVLAATTAVVSGLIPALHASRPDVASQLREGARREGGISSRGTRNMLVAAEVSLALVLLTGAGLLIRTLWNMEHLSRGFDATGVATATVSPPASSYPRPLDVRSFHERFLERVRTLPGVESAALTSGVLQPLLANSGIFTIEGRPLPPPEERIEYPRESVSPGYFETLRIPIVRGRGFTTQDHSDAPVVVVINETLARDGWPGQDPIGRRIRPGAENSRAPWMTVVGVIKDVHRVAPQRAIRPEVYMCAWQVTPRTLSLVIRAVDPEGIIPSVRRELQAIDPQLPLFDVGTLEGEIAQTLTRPRFQATLLAVFAGIALLLASVGIYGVTAHAVSQRTQEVGIRMALGARGGDVVRLMLGQHLRPALVGTVLGLAASMALTRMLQSFLYGVRPADPLTFAGTSLLLLAVALAACWIPVRRAMRVDPLIALRAE